jgi:hypothetical protein
MTMLLNPTTLVDPNGSVLTIPHTIAANARELDDIRTARKVLEDREATLRASVLAFLDEKAVDAVTDGTVTISRSNSTRKGVDRSKLEALYPQVLRDVETTTPVTQIRVKIKG